MKKEPHTPPQLHGMEKPRGNFSADNHPILPPNWMEIHASGPLRRLSEKFTPRFRDDTDYHGVSIIVLALMLGAQSAKELARRALTALLAGLLALLLNAAFVSTHAFDLFWEPVSARFGEGLLILPLILAAFFSGAVIGSILTLIFRRYTLRLACFVALLTGLLSALVSLSGLTGLSQGEQTWFCISSCSVPVGIYIGAAIAGIFNTQ